MRNPTDIRGWTLLRRKLHLYEGELITITALLVRAVMTIIHNKLTNPNGVMKIIHNKLTNPTDLLPRPMNQLLHCIIHISFDYRFNVNRFPSGELALPVPVPSSCGLGQLSFSHCLSKPEPFILKQLFPTGKHKVSELKQVVEWRHTGKWAQLCHSYHVLAAENWLVMSNPIVSLSWVPLVVPSRYSHHLAEYWMCNRLCLFVLFHL